MYRRRGAGPRGELGQGLSKSIIIILITITIMIPMNHSHSNSKSNNNNNINNNSNTNNNKWPPRSGGQRAEARFSTLPSEKHKLYTSSPASRYRFRYFFYSLICKVPSSALNLIDPGLRRVRRPDDRGRDGVDHLHPICFFFHLDGSAPPGLRVG